MISSVRWIPLGVADPKPKRYQISPAELEMWEQEKRKQTLSQAMMTTTISESNHNDDENDNNNNSNNNNNNKLEDELPSDLRMDEYSSDEGEANVGKLLIGKESEILDLEDAMDDDDKEAEGDADADADVTVDNEGELEEDDKDEEDDNDDDDDLIGDDDDDDAREYTPVDVKGLEDMNLVKIDGFVELNEDEDENDSDHEDTNLRSTDALLIVAKTEGDFASLEVHVYEQDTGNHYIHHDLPLPSYPLCLAHGDLCGDQAGNVCAVGTFSPTIELWNLDVLDVLEPLAMLGHSSSSSSSDPTSTLSPHTDAVTSLAWNVIHRQALASGSADTSVKLWDVTSHQQVSTLAHHTKPVVAVAWHPTEGSLLATGSYDRTVALVDARSSSTKILSHKLPADCEAVAWDPFCAHRLAVATEDGTLTLWDVRYLNNQNNNNNQHNQNNKPISHTVHEFGVSDLAFNPSVEGLLATCSVDKTVALWDLSNNTINNAEESTESTPWCHSCLSKEMNVGKLFTVHFYPSAPWLLACGGSETEVALWDLSSEPTLHDRFQGRVRSTHSTTMDNDSDNQNQNHKDMISFGTHATEDTANTTPTSSTPHPTKTPLSSKNKKKKKRTKDKKRAAHKKGH